MLGLCKFQIQLIIHFAFSLIRRKLTETFFTRHNLARATARRAPAPRWHATQARLAPVAGLTWVNLGRASRTRHRAGRRTERRRRRRFSARRSTSFAPTASTRRDLSTGHDRTARDHRKRRRRHAAAAVEHGHHGVAVLGSEEGSEDVREVRQLTLDA